MEKRVITLNFNVIGLKALFTQLLRPTSGLLNRSSAIGQTAAVPVTGGNFRKSRKFIITTLVMCLGSLAMFAQVSVNPGAGSYSTLNAAFTAINAGTHTGVITVTVTNNTTEPATAVPLVASGVGAANYVSISIKPLGGNWTINSAAAPTASRGMIELNGADNVTIDGDDPSTSGVRNLTFAMATSTSTGVAAIRLSSTSTTGTDGANNITIKNCNIIGSRSSTTSTTTGYGIVMANSSSITTGAYSSLNTIIDNNRITRCYEGIYANGSSASFPNTGLQITNNIIGTDAAGYSDATSNGHYGIYLNYTATSTSGGAAIVRGNDIRGGGTTGYSALVTAIYLNNSDFGAIIEKNNIHDLLQPSSGGWGPIGIYIPTASDQITIRNNFITRLSGYTYLSSPTASWNTNGIFVSAAATNMNIDFNTILLNVPIAGSTANTGSGCIVINSTTATIASLRNNIILNTLTSTQAFGLYCSATINISGGTINNNDYYVPNGNVGFYTSARTSLSAWQSATGKDGNSLNLNPPFVSSTDFHLIFGTPTAMESGGTIVSGITTDFDGDTRPGPAGSVNGGATAPDIGADEFDGVPAINCGSPGTPVASSVTATTATLSWTAGTSATQYNWELRTSGACGSGAPLQSGTTSSLSVALTGLNANSFYTFCVRSDCGGGVFSSYSSSSFSAYCIPTAGSSSTSYYLNNITTTGGSTNISYTASSYSPYVNALSQSISQYATGTYGISLASAGSGTYYYFVWVDWNNDLDFLDANELVVNQAAYVATYSNSALVVPATAAIGSYRMRVTTAEISILSSAYCGPNAYGNYVDFTFNVTSPPTCLPPTSLNAAGGAPNVTVSWGLPIAGSPVNYNWEVRSSGAGGSGAAGLVESGSTVAPTQSATTSTLAAGTTYNLWVRTDCGSGDFSSWAGPFAFYSSPLSYNVTKTNGISYTSIQSSSGGAGSPMFTTGATTNDDQLSDALLFSSFSPAFNFNYQGQAVSQVKACTNGWLTVSTTNTSNAWVNNLGTVAATTNGKIAPFWDDLRAFPLTTATINRNTFHIQYQMTGTAPNRALIVDWHCYSYGNTGPDVNLNFQVILYESGGVNSNQIEFKYGNFSAWDGLNDFGYSYSSGLNGFLAGTSLAGNVFAQQSENTNIFSNANTGTDATGAENLTASPLCYSSIRFIPNVTYGGGSALPAITNDECANAISLSLGSGPPTTYCSKYRSAGATNSGITLPAGLAGTNPDDDVWFTFDVTGSPKDVTVFVPGEGGYNPAVEVFSGTCGSLTSIGSRNVTGNGLRETLALPGLAIGTYYVRVFHTGTGFGTTPANGSTAFSSKGYFAIEAYETPAVPANDEICGAAVLTQGATCVTTTGFTAGATQSPQAACAGAPDDDVWYSVVGNGSPVEINVQSAVGFDAVVEIFTSSNNTCSGTLTQVSCLGPFGGGSLNSQLITTTAGTVYFVRVYHTASFSGSGTFTICAVAPVPVCIAGPGAPQNGGTVCISSTSSLNWAAATYATMYDVYFDAGTTATTLRSANQSGLSYNPGALITGAGTYAWKVVPKNTNGTSSGCSTWTFTVNDPQISGTTPDSRCGPGPVTLSATASSGTIKWYANATGGSPLASGPTYTPNITGTTTFYAAAQTGGGGASSLNLMPLAGGNGCGGGNMINITPTVNLDITGFTANLGASAGTSVAVSIYYKTGTYLGSETTSGAWTLHQTVNVTAAGPNSPTLISINPLPLTPQTYGFFINADLDYTDVSGATTFSNADLTAQVGAGLCGLFTGLNANRGFNGTIHYSAGCEGARVPVVANMSTPPAMTVSPNVTACANVNSTLTVSSPNDPNYTYTWMPGNLSGSSVTVNPQATTTYTVNAIDNTVGPNAGCTNTGSVVVTVNIAPTTPTITPASALLCEDDTVKLKGSSLMPHTGTLGTQAAQNTLTTYPAPYSVYFGAQRMQMLVTAAELIAAGYTAGSEFSGIQFPVVSLGSNWGSSLTSCNSFQISIGATNLTSITAFQSGLTQVVAPGNFTPVVGYNNTHTFNAPFTWNGTSNIIIETTFGNNITGVSADGVIQYNSPTSYQSTISYRADGVTAAAAAVATTISASYSARPDFKLVGVASSPVVWSPVTDLFNDEDLTIPYTGGLRDSVYSHPSTTRTYTATATIGSCTASSQVVVTVDVIPQVNITPSGPTSYCPGSTITLTANTDPTYTNYEWAPNGPTGAGANTFVVGGATNTTTVYTVTATGAGGCTSHQDIPVTVFDTLPPDIFVAASVFGSPIICTGDFATISAELYGATGPAQAYNWSTNETDPFIIVTTGGTYSVEVTDINGCVTHASAVLTESTPPPAPIIVALGDVNLCTYDDGGTWASVVLHTTNYSSNLSWSTGFDVTQDITVAYPDEFYVTYTDGIGCSSSSNHLFTYSKLASTAPVNSQVTSNAPGNVTCAAPITLTLAAAASTDHLGDGFLGDGAQWVWYLDGCGVGAPVGTGTTINVTPPAVPGPHTYYVRAEGGCATTACASIVITVKSLSTDPTSASASVSALCAGDQTILSVTGGSLGTGANWKWYAGSCGGSLVGIGASVTVNTSATTTYYVRAEGDCNVTACQSTTVTVNTPSTDPTTATSNAPVNGICLGGNVTLTVSGGTLGSGSKYYWYEDGCGNGSPIDSGVSITITPAFEGLHSYYVRAEGPCNTTNCAAVSVLVGTYSTEAAGITSSVIGNSICTGNNITLTLNGGFLGTVAQWKWYSGSCGGTLAGTGTTITVSPAVTTTYYVRAEGSCNNTICVSIVVNVSTTAPTGNPPTITTAPNGICSGNGSTVACNPVAGATFYSWSAPNGTTFDGGNPSPYVTTSNSVQVNFGNLPNGISGYDICVFAGNGCGNSVTKCRYIRGRVQSAQTISGNASSCPNTTSAYSIVSLPGADTYTWTVTGAATINGGGATLTTTSTTVNVNFLAGWTSGTLSVYGSMNCGYNGPTKTITIISTPVVPGVMSGPTLVCPGGTYTYSIAPVAGAISYNWSTNVPGAVIGAGTTSVSITFPAVIPTGSTVSVTATGSCGTSAPRVKNIATGLANTPGTISGPSSGQCGQLGVSYSILPVPGATSYLWSATNGATINGLNFITSANVDFPANFTTSTVSVIAINSCGNSAPQTKVVTGAPASAGVISNPGAVCVGGTYNYSVPGSTGATNYVWTSPAGSTITNGQGTPNISVLYFDNTGGSVTVYASNACGSSSTSTLAVSVICRLAQLTNGSVLDAMLYPNPTTGSTTLKFETITAGDYKVSVVDMTGQIMQTSTITAIEGQNMHELDLSTYAKGLYMVRLERAGEAAQMMRVTVE